MLERYVAPSKYTEAPYGTVCKVLLDKPVYYMQTSPNPDTYTWLTLDYMIARIFEPLFDRQEFCNTVLSLFLDDDRCPKSLISLLPTLNTDDLF